MVDVMQVMQQRFSGLFESSQEGPLTRVRIGEVTVQHHSGTGNILLWSGNVARTPASRSLAEKFGIHVSTGPQGTRFSAKLHAACSTEDELVIHLLKLQRAATSSKLLHRAAPQLALA